ncbi:MAG: hypothetical protein IPN76_22685 [Saprospiraceae bacterium]|nr:hypothetical protein [Saprospiraceae bacterium]
MSNFVKFFIIFIVLIQAQLLLSQKIDIFRQRWVLGWSPEFVYARGEELYPSEQEYTFLVLGSSMNLGFFLNKNIMLGFQGNYSFRAGGNTMKDFPNLWSLAYFARYYPFEGDKKIGFKSQICDNCATFKVRPFLQGIHRFSNNQIRNEKNNGLDYLGVQQVGLTAGVNLRLRKNLFYDAGIGLRYTLTNSDERLSNEGIFGLSYHFGYNSNPQNKNISECNSTCINGIGSCLVRQLKKREPNPKAIMVGTSLTYGIDSSFNVEGKGGKHKELSWNINAVAQLTRRVRAGINTIQIFTNDPVYGDRRFYLAGGIVQYEPFLGKKNFFLFEGGLMYGNYGTFGAGDPRKRNGLLYSDLGGSFNWRLTQKLYLELGFNNYFILNKAAGKYAYNQYIVGVNYVIIKK